MTTIALRNGVMAGDSQVNCGHLKYGQIQKVRRIGNWIIGVSGSFDCMEQFFHWARTGFDCSKRPDLKALHEPSFSAIVLNASDPEDIIEYEIDLVPQRFCAPYRAIGSGRDFAIGAMAMGASAVQAIEIACLHDRSTGGKIFMESA
jgi:ATP-dependent protease HslVU (ClpYQ) peptidase subunit